MVMWIFRATRLNAVTDLRRGKMTRFPLREGVTESPTGKMIRLRRGDTGPRMSRATPPRTPFTEIRVETRPNRRRDITTSVTEIPIRASMIIGFGLRRLPTTTTTTSSIRIFRMTWPWIRWRRLRSTPLRDHLNRGNSRLRRRPREGHHHHHLTERLRREISIPRRGPTPVTGLLRNKTSILCLRCKIITADNKILILRNNNILTDNNNSNSRRRGRSWPTDNSSNFHRR